MVTLEEKAAKLNSALLVSYDSGRLSSDSSLILIDELIDAFHFTDHSKDVVLFNNNRFYRRQEEDWRII